MAGQQNNVQEQDINKLRKVRREKLAELQANGQDPFEITKFDVTHHSNEVKVNFEGFDYLLLWTIPNENYICIEPWCGITDSVNTDQNFKTKEGILKVNSNSTYSCTHSFEILG